MNKVADVAMGLIVVAAIFTLVRPRSQGPQFVTNIGNAFTRALEAATGGGTF